jgi:acyl carrier protein
MPTFPDVAAAVRELVTDNFVYRAEAGPLPESASLLEAGLIDSTGVLELVALLESTFSIRVADEEVVPENLDSIGRITAFVRRKLGAGGGLAHAG